MPMSPSWSGHLSSKQVIAGSIPAVGSKRPKAPTRVKQGVSRSRQPLNDAEPPGIFVVAAVQNVRRRHAGLAQKAERWSCTPLRRVRILQPAPTEHLPAEVCGPPVKDSLFGGAAK